MLLGIITSIDPEESVEIFEGVAAELYTAPGPLTSNGDKPTCPTNEHKGRRSWQFCLQTCTHWSICLDNLFTQT